MRRLNWAYGQGNEPCPPPPTVQMSRANWQLLMAYVNSCRTTEINGFGMVTQHGNMFRVNEIVVVKQEVAGGHAQTDDDAFAQLLYEMTRDGKDTSQLIFQWHSHCHGPAFFSGTDTATMDRWPGDLFISLVTNFREDTSVCIDVYKPFHTRTYCDLVIVDPPLPATVMADVAAEVTEKVKVLPPPPPKKWKRPRRPSDDEDDEGDDDDDEDLVDWIIRKTGLGSGVTVREPGYVPPPVAKKNVVEPLFEKPQAAATGGR